MKGAAMNESPPGTDKSWDSKDGPDTQESAGLVLKDPKNTTTRLVLNERWKTLRQSHRADLIVGSLVPSDLRPPD